MAKDDYESAAVASEAAADIYGLHIIERKIDRHIHNFTRFLVIGTQIPNRTGNDKTTFIFSVKMRWELYIRHLSLYTDTG